MGWSHRGLSEGKYYFLGWQSEWVSVCACVPFGFGLGYGFINSNVTESEVERVICMEKERSM